MFSTAEIAARQPLLKVVRDNHGVTDDNEPRHQLARKARAFSHNDPLIERQIRRCEEAAQMPEQRRCRISGRTNEHPAIAQKE